MLKKKKKVCIIGIGKHAYINLIPSLKKKNFKIVGLVSRSPKFFNRSFKVYKDLNTAIKTLPKDTLYILSTPPRTHFKIIKNLICRNKNVLVEKPVVINKEQIQQINNLNFSKKTLFMKCICINLLNVIKSQLIFIKTILKTLN